MTSPESQDQKTATLKARAQALARGSQAALDANSKLEVVAFGLATERYGIEAAYVTEAHPLDDLAPIPCVPRFVRGLVNVRGRIVPVIDLKQFFDLPETGITDLHSVLLLRAADMEIGLLADIVIGLHEIPLSSIQPSLPTLTGIRADYLKGVTADGLVVLDAARILADRRIIVHEEVEG